MSPMMFPPRIFWRDVVVKMYRATSRRDMATIVAGSRMRSRGAFAPGAFGRCVLEISPRARRTPRVQRTHGPRHLATLKRNGDPTKHRRPFVAKPQLRRPARGV